MRWIKASERTPYSGGDIIWRFIGQTNIVGCCYKHMMGFILDDNHYYNNNSDYDKIEWLEEIEINIDNLQEFMDRYHSPKNYSNLVGGYYYKDAEMKEILKDAILSIKREEAIEKILK